VGPTAGLETEARGKIPYPLPGIESRSPGRPARSQTLYRLSYPGSPLINTSKFKTALMEYEVRLETGKGMKSFRYGFQIMQKNK
jgi:hypothetical protein